MICWRIEEPIYTGTSSRRRLEQQHILRGWARGAVTAPFFYCKNLLTFMVRRTIIEVGIVQCTITIERG